MRKNKLIYGLIALVGGASVLGSAFCAWQFGETVEASANGTISTELAHLATDAGKIELNTQRFFLMLDQGIRDVTNANYSNVGLYILDDSGNEVEEDSMNATYTVSSDVYTNVISVSRDFSLSATITIPQALKEYITVNEATSGFVSEGDDVTFKKEFSLDANSITNSGANVVSTLEINGSRVNGVNQLFKWVNKPTTLDEYNTLNDVILKNTEDISLTFSATFGE